MSQFTAQDIDTNLYKDLEPFHYSKTLWIEHETQHQKHFKRKENKK